MCGFFNTAHCWVSDYCHFPVNFSVYLIAYFLGLTFFLILLCFFCFTYFSIFAHDQVGRSSFHSLLGLVALLVQMAAEATRLKLISLNANGLNVPEKRTQLLRELRRMRADIMFL